MGKKLLETLQIQLIVDPNTSIVVDNMISEWGAVPYAPLSVVLVNLRFLSCVHQTHHWQSKGDPFYGDHLMFERLYNEVTSEIDAVAEKSIGLGCNENVNLVLQTAQLARLASGYGMSQTIPQPTELAKRSMIAEVNFLKAVDTIVCGMKECGMLTRGLDNLIAGIQDVHEGHVYLLKQRCTQGV